MRPFGIQARCRLRVDMRRAHDVGKGSFEPIPDDGHRLLTAESRRRPEGRSRSQTSRRFNGKDVNPLRGSISFNCLSHDIVAHQMTHALLDGMRTRVPGPNQP
jgi:hypothetical protein